MEAEEFQPQAVDRGVEQGGENNESPEEEEDGRMKPGVERREMARAERGVSSDEADETGPELQ